MHPKDNLRWKAIIHFYRFKAYVGSWAIAIGIFLRMNVVIGFRAIAAAKLRMKSNIGIDIKFYGYVRQMAKSYMKAILGIGMAALLKLKAKVNMSSGLEIGFLSFLKTKFGFIFFRKLGIEFDAFFTRKRGMKKKDKIGIGHKSRAYKLGRLIFDNRKPTIWTAGLLKKLTIDELKQKIVRIMKQEWRIIPQFKVEFSANLRLATAESEEP